MRRINARLQTTIIMLSVFLVGLLCWGTEVSAAASGTVPCSVGSVTWTLSDDGEMVFSGSGTTNISSATGYSNWYYYWSKIGIDRELVTSVSVASGSNIVLNTAYSMFEYFTNCTTIDMTGFNTGNVTTMYAMFKECEALTSLNITGLNTANVTTMEYMFYNCSSLTSLDVSSFNTVNVDNMQGMFGQCEKLKKLDLSNFNTGKVTDMSSMFSSCAVMTSLDVSTFNTSSVKDMSNMFHNCEGLDTVNVSSFNTSSVTDMSGMFALCDDLETLDLTKFVTDKVTDMSDMFSSCSSLTELDLSKFNTTSVTNMYSMFRSCTSITQLDLRSFNTANVTNMEAMFLYCYDLESIDMSSFNTSKVTNMSAMFRSCRSLKTLDLSNFTTSNVTNFSNFVYSCDALKTLDLSALDTSASTNAITIYGTSFKKIITPKTATKLLLDGSLFVKRIWYDDDLNFYHTGDTVTFAPQTVLYQAYETYSIDYEYDYGGTLVDCPDEYEVEYGVSEFGTVTREHYTFGGWYSDEEYTTEVTSIPIGTTGDQTLYAKMIPDTYSITYYNTDKATTTEGLFAEYAYGIGYTLPTLESTCYEFVGWYEDEELTKRLYSISKYASGDLNLYAKWRPIYEIEIRNAKEPTCQEKGYTGDSHCNICGELIAEGEEIEIVDHDDSVRKNRVAASCTTEGYTGDKHCKWCDVLVEEGSVVSKLPHDNSVVKNVAEATCTADGYTGDKHCKHCDTLVEQGEAIAKKGHDVDKTNGTITTPATATTEGEIQYKCKNCDYTEKEKLPKTGADFAKEQGISEETLAVTDETILATKNDNDIAGSSFAAIQARADKTTKNSVRLKWNKVKNADGYKIYGNKCGKKNSYKYIKTISNGNTTKYTQKKLKKGTYYKYIVRAYKLIDGQEVTIAASKTIHASTTGGKYGNAKSVKLKTDSKMKSKKGSYTLTIKKNKKYTIKASEVKQSKKIKQHRKIAFESGDTSIATVTKKGAVKGKKKGTCYIYAYAQNGAYQKIKVRVN